MTKNWSQKEDIGAVETSSIIRLFLLTHSVIEDFKPSTDLSIIHTLFFLRFLLTTIPIPLHSRKSPTPSSSIIILRHHLLFSVALKPIFLSGLPLPYEFSKSYRLTSSFLLFVFLHQLSLIIFLLFPNSFSYLSIFLFFWLIIHFS